MRRTAMLLAILTTLPGFFSCSEDVGSSAAETAGGSIARGKLAVASYGCVSCHTIPGIRGADALVGPPLDRIASRTYVAGVLVNTPENMVRWVKDPPKVDPLTAMPDLHLSDAEARDVASFLSTLR